jgi:hypothetical protein
MGEDPFAEESSIQTHHPVLTLTVVYRARFDKRADNFLAGVKLASLRIWMRFNESIA